MSVDAEDLLRLGRPIESLLESIRTRLGLLIFFAVVPICVGFGIGLALGLEDGGTNGDTAALAGILAGGVLTFIAAVLLLLPSGNR